MRIIRPEHRKMAKMRVDPARSNDASYLFLGSLLLGILLSLIILGTVLGGLILLLLSAERNPVGKEKNIVSPRSRCTSEIRTENDQQ